MRLYNMYIYIVFFLELNLCHFVPFTFLVYINHPPICHQNLKIPYSVRMDRMDRLQKPNSKRGRLEPPRSPQ